MNRKSEQFPKIKIVGGVMDFKELRRGANEKEFDVLKAHVWLGMVNRGMRPTDWKTSEDGTSVTFEHFKVGDVPGVYDEELDRISKYLDGVEAKHGVSLKNRKAES